MIKMTKEEYLKANSDYQGICLACGKLRDETEPDAEGYECDHCGQPKVLGIETALILGELDIVEEEEFVEAEEA